MKSIKLVRLCIALALLIILTGCSQTPATEAPINTPTIDLGSLPAPTRPPDPTITPEPTLTPYPANMPRSGAVLVIDKPEIVGSYNLSGDVDLTGLRQAIPEEWTPKKDTQPGYQIHLHLVPVEVEACKYTGANYESSVVTRFVPNVEATIIDTRNGEKVASNVFPGNYPDACSDIEKFARDPQSSTYNAKALVGTAPDPSSFSKWLFTITRDGKLDLPLETLGKDISVPISKLALSPDGKKMAVLGEDSIVRLWDLQDGIKSAGIFTQFERPVTAIEFSPDGKALAAAIDNPTTISKPPIGAQVTFWDVSTMAEVNSFDTGETFQIDQILFSPDGKQLIIDPGRLMIWDLDAGKGIDKVQFYNFNRYATFSPDGKTLAVDNTRHIFFYNTTTWEEVSRFSTYGEISSPLYYLPDGKRIAAEQNQCRMDIFQKDGSEDTQHIVMETDEIGCRDRFFPNIRFSADGSFFAASTKPVIVVNGGYAAEVRFWKLETGELFQTIQMGEAEIRDMLLSPDGKTLITGDSSGNVTFWDVETGKQVQQFKNKIYNPQK